MAIHKMIKYHFVRSVIKNVHTRISQWRGEPIKRSLMRENPSSDILKKQSQYTDSVFKWRRNRRTPMAIHKMIKYHFVRSVIKNVHTRISQWRGEPIKRSLMRENPSSDILKKQSQYTDSVFKWRRNRDSNPRYP